MMRTRLVVLAAVLAAAVIAACSGSDQSLTVSVGTTGTVTGLVYFDRNGNRVPDGADTALSGVRVRVIPQGSFDTLGKATSDANGFFKIRNLPVGRYRVVVDTGGIAGDSLRLTRVTRDTFTLAPDDSLGVDAALSYPELTVAQFRALAIGKKAFLVAVSSVDFSGAGGTF